MSGNPNFSINEAFQFWGKNSHYWAVVVCGNYWLLSYFFTMQCLSCLLYNTTNYLLCDAR